MMLNCIIIEDEPLALERTKNYALKVPYLNLIHTFDNSLEAMGFIKSNQVDLLFLDIEMDELTGIDMLQVLKNPPEVIITTAYEKYALKGYELNITDYLLKPFSFERLLQASEKVFNKMKDKPKQQKEFLFVKTEYRIEKIPLSKVLYIEGMRDYRCIQTTSKKILTLQTFSELEAYLPIEKFCRVHKSYLVAIEQIAFVERNRIKIQDKRIPISNTYKSRFYKLIGFSK
ncbi:MAG: LytTR family DNA-binding domain-containing protein [Bacteroidota bacterium]